MTRTLQTLGIDVDLRTHPWRYPGPAAPSSGLLSGGSFHELRRDDGTWTDADGTGLEALLDDAGVPGLDDRQAVVAIGSNASPAVMHRKFTRLEVSTTVPMLAGDLAGVGLGHIPRVNPAGYVAAVPLVAPGGRTAVVVSLLTPAQADALDATEQSYARCAGGDGLTVAGHDEPWSLYVSELGAIGGTDGLPLPLGTQSDLWDRLRTDPVLAGLAGDGDHREVARRLAADGSLRDRVRDHLVTHDRVVPTGMEDLLPTA